MFCVSAFSLLVLLFGQCGGFFVPVSTFFSQSSTVFFNRGSAEPKGSASICQVFRGCMVSKKINLACKVTSDQATEAISTVYLVQNLRFQPSTFAYSVEYFFFVNNVIIFVLNTEH